MSSEPEDPLLHFLRGLDGAANSEEGLQLLLRFAREVSGEAARPVPPTMALEGSSLLELRSGLVGSESGPNYRINAFLYVENPDELEPSALALLESASRLLEHRFAHERDGLTGLLTHRVFQDRLIEEFERAARLDEPLVLVMVDADNFKPFNDKMGHRAGDALLREMAALLRDKTRASDLVCRYGGDEFALLLKNTLKADAARLCERIREAFQLRFGAYGVQVTSSIGLACYPTDADSKKDLAQAADDALYVSKRGGGNRVSVSKDLKTRRREGPMVVEVLRRPAEIEKEKQAAWRAEQEARRKAGLPPEDEPPWEHPHTSPLKPPPKNVPGSGHRRFE